LQHVVGVEKIFNGMYS